MSARAVPSRSSARRLPLLLCLLCPALAPVHAQDAPGASSEQAATEDPKLIVARTVQPRIAWHHVPRDQNPVRAEATLFPAGVFRSTIDALVDNLVDDSALGERGSAGIGDTAVPMVGGAVAPLPDLLAGTVVRGGTALGPAASVTGAVSGATRGIGAALGGSLVPALDPARLGGGP